MPLFQKVAFGVGMLGNQMFPAALGIFMVVLVQGLGMSPVLWGILFALPRLSDALTDPVMGFVTDNTRSRWGRRRPYIFIGAIIAGVSYIFMWQLDPANSELFNFFYFLIFAFIFYLGLTIFATPYVAMGYEMSNDFHERTRLMAVAQWIGQWAWVIVPWFWVFIYDGDPDPGRPVENARTLAIYVGIGCMLMALVPAIFCRSKPVVSGDWRVHREGVAVCRRCGYEVGGLEACPECGPAAPEGAQGASLSLSSLGRHARELGKGLWATLKCGPFVRICIATFFVFNAFNTVAGFSWFIIVYYMNGGDPGVAGRWPTYFGTASALMTCFVSIPIVTLLSQKLGKKSAFMISQGISIFGYAAFWWCFDPSRPWLMFVPLPLFAFGIGGLFTIMMSMTADVCDLDELSTGERREGVFGAVYWWMVKVGFAGAGLGGGLILEFIGFDQSVQEQTKGALAGLRVAYIAVPVVGTLLAMLVMAGYDLTEARSREIRREIEARGG